MALLTSYRQVARHCLNISHSLRSKGKVNEKWEQTSDQMVPGTWRLQLQDGP